MALRQAVKDKTGVAKSIEEYSQLYLRRRNSIMLIYKFICPYFFSLWELKTDHYVPIFVLAKNSYKELKELFGHLVCKKNFLKLEPNFDAFVVSDSYEQLVLLIKEQLQ